MATCGIWDDDEIIQEVAYETTTVECLPCKTTLAECWTCQTAILGSWNMTAAGSPYDRTGRYLGVQGWFLYGESANWVYCYCKPCWQKEILKLPFVARREEYNVLQQQITTFQQQLKTSQQQNESLQQQLNASRAESTSFKKQLDEISEKYQKLSNTSGIDKLRDLLKQLTSAQVNTLHKHTSFRADIFETMHGEQQLQCSLQFVQSSLQQLKSSVDAVIQLQKNTLTQRKQAKESVTQTLATAGVPKAITDASIKPLETEIGQIEADIERWNTFSTVLIGVANQSIPASGLHEESVKEKL